MLSEQDSIKTMKIAIIKQGGLCAGGTEKYLQQIAVELKNKGHKVDYFYTDSVPCGPNGWIHPGTDPDREIHMKNNGISLFEVKCNSIDALESGGKWNNTNFYDLFDQSEYNVVIGGHKGEPCWPFSEIKGPRIIETVHGTNFTSGASRYANAYILISECQKEKWHRSGGDYQRTHIIAPMVSVDMSKADRNRAVWNIPAERFVFGMHQSSREGLFSSVPLDSYSLIQNDDNFFVILGGTEEYDNHARRIGLKNFFRIPAVSDSAQINSFLSCLDAYSHGRFDGEVCSSAIIEAMAHSLPIISHPSRFNNGHAYQINGCGFFASSVEEYANMMRSLQYDKNLRTTSSEKTREKYRSEFSFDTCRQSLLDVILGND